MLTAEQHNVLVQLAQLGLQRLTETATTALQACAPVTAPQPLETPPDPPE